MNSKVVNLFKRGIASLRDLMRLRLVVITTEQQVHNLAIEVSALRKEVKKAMAAIDDLTAQITALEAAEAARATEDAAFQADVTRLLNDLKAVVAAGTSPDDAIEALETRIQALTTSSTAATTAETAADAAVNSGDPAPAPAAPADPSAPAS